MAASWTQWGAAIGPCPSRYALGVCPTIFPEGSTKCPEAAETHVEADVGHGAVTLAQQKHRPLDTPPLQVPMGRLTEDRAKAAAEMGGRNVGHRRHSAHVERPGVGPVHCVTGTQQSPVQFFGLAAHTPRLGELRRLDPLESCDCSTPLTPLAIQPDVSSGISIKGEVSRRLLATARLRRPAAAPGRRPRRHHRFPASSPTAGARPG